MSLHAALSRVRTEEDVKDAYIAALGLKGVNKGLVDIQTPERDRLEMGMKDNSKIQQKFHKRSDAIGVIIICNGEG